MVWSRILCSLGKSVLALTFSALCAVSAAQAGPLEEIRSLAQFPSLDPASLKSGKIVTQRGSANHFARGISLESAYFIHAPLAVVGPRLLHWDPRRHPEMETRLYHEYNLAKPRDAFQSLRLDPTISSDGWLLEHTYTVAGGGAIDDLHLTSEEVSLIRKMVPREKSAPAAVRVAKANEAWREILRARSNHLSKGGLQGIPPYRSDRSISPGSEFKSLLTLNSAAAKQFRPLITARPLNGNGPAADEAVGYWETAEVRGHTTLQLGVFAARKTAAAWQLADCVYYPSDTYFMALDLFQLWSWDGGTLVWQVGYVSAPFRTYLGGIDRYVAGKQQLEETIAAIKAFRSDVEKKPQVTPGFVSGARPHRKR